MGRVVGQMGATVEEVGPQGPHASYDGKAAVRLISLTYSTKKLCKYNSELNHIRNMTKPEDDDLKLDPVAFAGPVLEQGAGRVVRGGAHPETVLPRVRR